MYISEESLVTIAVTRRRNTMPVLAYIGVDVRFVDTVEFLFVNVAYTKAKHSMQVQVQHHFKGKVQEFSNLNRLSSFVHWFMWGVSCVTTATVTE